MIDEDNAQKIIMKFFFGVFLVSLHLNNRKKRLWYRPENILRNFGNNYEF